MNKHILLFCNFVKEYSVLRFLIPMTLFFVGVNVYLQALLLIDPAKILSIIGTSGGMQKGTNLLVNQMSKTFFVLILSCTLPCITDYYLTKLYRICVCYHVTKALNIEHIVYHEKGSGRIMSIIERKAQHYVLGIDMIVHKILASSLFCCFIAYFVYKEFKGMVLMLMVFNASVTVFINWPLINLKRWYRKSYIEKYNTMKTQILSIIVNYDIIKANNKENEEIENLNDILDECAQSRIEGSCLRYTSGFVSKVCTILINGLLFYFALRKNKYLLSIATAEKFVCYNALFVMAKSKVNDVRIYILQFTHFWSDVQSEDWDDYKYDIENLEYYYNHKKDHKSSEIQFEDIDTTANAKESVDKIRCNNSLSANDQYAKFCDTDFGIIKSTVLQSYKPDNADNDGINSFVFSECLQFTNFSLFVKNRTLINPSNFTICKGEKVGIVGKNGSGKSTFMNVLLRYRKYKGDVYVDGVEMRNINKVSQRENTAYVPQTPGILGGTIFDNIIYCNSSLSADDVARVCNRYEIVFDDLKKDVGENGKFISGGQKQKIGFLRGMLKDTDIILLDEPTASMDPGSERNIINKIHTQMSDKTVIAIIHNLGLLAKFDKILVFHNQEIIVYNDYQEFTKDSHLYY